MLIIGNSHVSIFDHGIECDQEQISIKYVGPLSIDWFCQQHPEAKKVYRGFDLETGWKILFIGNHDMYKLLSDAFENDVSKAFAAMLNKYKEVFVELNKNGKFAWAISMQQTNDIPVQFCTDKDFFQVVKEFNRQLTEWCLTQNIPVLDAISDIDSSEGGIQKQYLSTDELHFKPEYSSLYLEDLSQLSGLKLTKGKLLNEIDLKLSVKDPGVQEMQIYYPDQVAFLDHDDMVRYESREYYLELKELTVLLPEIRKKIEDGDFQEVENFIKQGLEKFPEFVDLIFLQALLFFRQQKNTEAEETLNRLESIWSYHAESYFLKAQLLTIKGQNESAETALSFAIKIDPLLSARKAAELNQQGEYLFSERRFDEAEKCFKESIDINSNSYEGFNNLGILEMEREHLDNAFQHLFHAYKLDPNNKVALINFNSVLRALDKNHEADEILSLYLDSNPGDNDIQQLLKQDEQYLTEKKQGEQEYIISAIVSTYNSDQFIAGRLDDLLNQTLADKVEIIVIDSCSPGNEQQIVADYQQRFNNIKYLRTNNRESVYQAWNRGLKLSAAPYVTNANTDDRLRPDALEVMVGALEANSEVALVYADYFITTAPIKDFTSHVRSGYCIRPDFHPSIMNSGCHMGPQPVWRKEIHSHLGYFDESYRSAADYDFWCRIATRYPMLHINRFLGVYYHNPAGIVNSNGELSVNETQQIKQKYAHNFPLGNAVPVPDYYYHQPWQDSEYVNIGMVTYNRLEFTRQAIESLVTHTRFPHVISVIDNNSQDGTQQYLTQLCEQGVIKNLILLKENIGVAKASNLAWQCEPGAGYYLKYDNDIIIQKPDWLKKLVEVANGVTRLGVVGYNFEPVSYELKEIDGFKIRPKHQGANVGGACVLIPKKIQNRLGFWCEDYGLYGEEDYDYGIRVTLSGLLNVYMEDEDIGFHLPAGKAATIDHFSFVAKDGLEESLDKAYREVKDAHRAKNMAPGGPFQRNLQAYQNYPDRLYVATNRLADNAFSLVLPESLKATVLKFQEKSDPDPEYPLVPISNSIKEPVQAKLKIGVLSLDFNKHACAFIRIQSIFQSLSDQISYRQIVNSHGDVDETVIKWADVIIIQRTAPRRESQELLDQIFASGCCVIYETDDLFTEKLPDTNYLSNAFEEHIPYIVDVAQRADLITTSTAFLAEKLSQYNTNVQVLPNLIDHRLWLKQQPAIVKNVQTIVYAGTQTHAADLECIENSLLKIHEKRQGRIKFIFIGCSTPDLRKLPGTEYYELVPYREYSALVQKLSVDIAIIPLLDGQFNNCKSNIKWLEYSMCGIAGVYSNVLPYQCIEDGKTGLLVNNNEGDWFNGLEWLIDNPEKRVEIGLAAQQQVIEKYTLATESKRYFQTWQSLSNSKLKPLEKNMTASSPEIGDIQFSDQDSLQQLSFASGLEAACQVLLTISEITGGSIFNTAITASATDSGFLSKYAVTNNELFLKLAEIVKNKATKKGEHDKGLLNQSLQFLYSIDHQSLYFEKSISLRVTVRQLLDDLQHQYWITNHSLLEVDAELFAERMMLKWQSRPSFHLLMFLFPEEQVLLADTLDSLGKQFYQEWGLTVISELPVPNPIFEQEDFLNWVQIQGNDDPYEILNALIADVESDWVAIVEPGTTFEPQTFIQIADYINIKPEWKLIYTDEDVAETDEAGNVIRSNAKFKPDFNLDLLRSTPYIGSFSVVERASLLEIEGVLANFGLENFEMALHINDAYGEQTIGHIADVLFHQPKTLHRPVSEEQIQNTVKRHLQRNVIEAEVVAGYIPESCRVIYQHRQDQKVSIIIPTKDKLEYLESCVESLLEKTEYPNYEVIIVDNQSSDPDVFDFYDALKQKHPEKIRIIDYPHVFNFSAICNYAADQADGEYLLLLNNDTEVLHKEWLGRMMMHGMRDDVGVVGARLVYPETGLLQHAGIIMGMDTIAGHPFIGQLHVKESGYMGRALLDQNYAAVTGACLLIEKKIYQSVNGMDEENLAVSYNDVDLCLKTSEAGYRVVWTPYSTLVHHGNVTQNSTTVSKEKVDRFKSEREAMFKKWQNIISEDPAYNRHLSLAKLDFSVEATMPCNWDVNFHDRLRVFGIPIDGAAGDYRLIQPFNSLRKTGLAQCEYLRLQNNAKDRINISEIARQKPDVLVLHSSVNDQNLELLEQCKMLLPDIFLIYMIDDLIDQVPEKSSAYRKIKRSFRDVKPRIRKALSYCDRAIVSTEPLADFCRGMIDDIKIVPNTLESNVWLGLESKRQQGNKLRVGWAGALQHQGDLELIAEIVQQTANEVDWVFMGMCPESIKPYIKEFQESVAISDYPEVLAGLNLDLAIAPLEDNSFNEAKSNLRLLEYGILGWPVICSDVYPYRGAPVTCVENTTESWLAAIRQAIDYPGDLPKQGDTLRQWVTADYLLEDNLERWLDALKPKS